MRETPDVDATVQQIEALLERLPPEAEEMIRLLMNLYGTALERILDVLRQAPADPLQGLAEDKLIASLLLVHNLHPIDAETRVRRVLERLPHTELIRIEDGVAHIRVQSNGIRWAPEQMENTIQRLVADAAPELAGIEIAGLPKKLVQIAPGS
jgi:hypothetical protein